MKSSQSPVWMHRMTRAPAHAIKWTYWNGQIYRVLAPKQLSAWRRSYKYHKPWKKFGIHDPVVVLQMGKVGSTAIYQSLSRLDLDVPIYHLHHLHRFDDLRARVLRSKFEHAPQLRDLEREEKLAAEIKQHRGRLLLISPVRNPIDRAISAFFEMLGLTIPNLEEKYARGELTVSQVTERFLQHISKGVPADWFDHQVKTFFGIDVYSIPFPHSQGYAIYESERARMLVVRVEDFRQTLSPAVERFLHIPNFELERANTSTEKSYSVLYKGLTDQIQLPEDWVHRVLDLPIAKHFYTEAERTASAQRWLGKRAIAI